MAFDVKDITSAAQDQFFTTLETVQDAVLEGVKLWNGAVKNVIPNELVDKLDSLPGAKYLPSPATYVAQQFDFAEKLLAQQRAFYTQLLSEAAPTPVASPLVTVGTASPAKAAAAK
jgi:hypothetical protein